MFFFEVVQIRLVLENVDVQLAFGQSEVRADVVGEFDQFDGIAFFLQRRLDLVFDHVAEVADGRAEDDFFFRRAVVGGRRCGGCGSWRAVFLTAAGCQYHGERGGGKGFEEGGCLHVLLLVSVKSIFQTASAVGTGGILNPFMGNGTVFYGEVQAFGGTVTQPD